MFHNFRDVRRGGPLHADDLNRSFDAAEQFFRFTVAAPLSLDPTPGGMLLRLDWQPPVLARITGHKKQDTTDDADLAKYSGVEQTADDATDGCFDLDGGMTWFTDTTYLKAANGSTGVPTDSIVRAWPSSDGEFWIFDQPPTSSGGDEVVRITYFFVKDSPDATACSGGPSPLCYYPGRIQSLDCTGPSDGTPVWVVFWYTQAAIPPLGVTDAPYTVVKCDGTAAHKAKYMGFSYAPDNGGDPVHPNNGESRPVYLSTEFAAAWFVSCDTDTPTATLAG